MSVSKFDIMSPSAASMIATSPRSSGAFAFSGSAATRGSSDAGSNAAGVGADAGTTAQPTTPAAPIQAVSAAATPAYTSARTTPAARSPPPSFGSVAAARGVGRGATGPPRSPPMGSTTLSPVTSGSMAAPLAATAAVAARTSSPTHPARRPSLPASFSLGSTAPSAAAATAAASSSGAASASIPSASVRGQTAAGRRPPSQAGAGAGVSLAGPSRSPTHARGASRSSDLNSATAGAGAIAGPVSASTSAFFSSGLSDEDLMLFDREYAHLMNQSPSLQRQALVAQRRHELEKAHALETARRAQAAQQKDAHAHVVRQGNAKHRREMTVGAAPGDGDDESNGGTFITEAPLGPSTSSDASSVAPPRAATPPAPAPAAPTPPMGFDQLFPFEQRDALNPRGGVGAGMIYYRLQGEVTATWNRSGLINAALATGAGAAAQQQPGDGSATSMKSSAGWRKRQALKTNPQILAQIDRYWSVFAQTTPPAITAAGVTAAAAASRALALPLEAAEEKSSAKAAAPYVSPRRTKAKQQQLTASASASPSAFPGITRSQYLSLHLSMTKALYEVWQLGAAQALAGVEWTKDLVAHDPKLAALTSLGTSGAASASVADAATGVAAPPPSSPKPKLKPAADPRNSLLMSHACFRRALFEMVDLWTESVEAAEYARFLDLLLLRITKPNPHAAVTDKRSGGAAAGGKARRKKALAPPPRSNPLLSSSPLVWRTLPEVLRFNRAITLPVGSFYKILLIQRWWRRWWGVRQRKAVSKISEWWVQWKPTLASKRARKQMAAVRIQRFFRRRRVARLQAHKARSEADQNLRRMASTVSEGDEHNHSSSSGEAEDEEDGVSIPSEHDEEDQPTELADADAQLSLRALREKLNHQARLDEQTRDLMLLLWCCRRLQKFWRRLQAKRQSQADYARKVAERRAFYIALGREKGEARRAAKLQRRPSMNLALLAMLEEAGLLSDEEGRGDETLAEAEARQLREAEQREAERLAIAEKDRAAAEEALMLREAAERAERVRDASAEKLVSSAIAAAGADLAAEAAALAAACEAVAKLAADAAALMVSSDARPLHEHVHHAYTAAQFPFVLGAGPVLALRMYCSSYRARHHASAPLSSTRVAAQFLHALLSKAVLRRKRNMHELESRIAHLKRRARRLEKEEGSRSLARLMQGFVEEQAASLGPTKRSSGGITVTLTNHASAVSSPALVPSRPPALSISQSNSPALAPLEEPTPAALHAIAGHGLPGLTLAAPSNGIGSPILSPRSSAAWSAQAWNPLLLQASAGSPRGVGTGVNAAGSQFPPPYDRNIPSPLSFSEALAQIEALENLPLHLASEALASEHAAAAARDSDNGSTKQTRPDSASDLSPPAAISTLRLHATYPKCNAKWITFVAQAFPFENPRWPRPGQNDSAPSAELDAAAAKQAEDAAAAAASAVSKPDLHRLRTQGGTLLQAEDLFHVGPLDRSHHEHEQHRLHLHRRASLKALAQSKGRELAKRHGGGGGGDEDDDENASLPSKTQRRVSINDPKSSQTTSSGSSSKRSKRYSAPAGAKISAASSSSAPLALSSAAKKKRATLPSSGFTEGVDEGEEEEERVEAEAAQGSEEAAEAESASATGDEAAVAGGKKLPKSQRTKKHAAAVDSGAPPLSAEDAALAAEAETAARKARRKAKKAQKRAKEQRKEQKQIQRRLRKAAVIQAASLLAADGRAGPSASDSTAAATSASGVSSLVAHLSDSSSSSSSSPSSRSTSVTSRSRASSRHSDSNWGASSRAARSGEEGGGEDESLSSDSDLEALLNAAHDPSSADEATATEAGGRTSRTSGSKVSSPKSSRSRRGSAHDLADASSAGAPMTKAEMSAYVAKLRDKQDRAAAAAAEEEAQVNASPRGRGKDAADSKPAMSRKSTTTGTTLHRGASKSNLASRDPTAAGSKPRGSVSFQRVSSVASLPGGRRPAMAGRTKSTGALLRAKSSSHLPTVSADAVAAGATVSSLLSNDIDAWSSDGGFTGGLNSDALKLEHLDDVTSKLLRNQEAGNLDMAAIIEARKPTNERKQTVVRQSKAASAAVEEPNALLVEADETAVIDQKEDDTVEPKPRSNAKPSAASALRPSEHTATPAPAQSRVVVREPNVFSPSPAARAGEPSIMLRIQQAPMSNTRDASPRTQQDSLPSQPESQRMEQDPSGLPPHNPQQHRQPLSQRRQPHHLEAALEAGQAARREYTGGLDSFSSRRNRRGRGRNRSNGISSFGSRPEYDGEEDVRDFAAAESGPSKGAGRGFSFKRSSFGRGDGNYTYDSGFVAGSAAEATALRGPEAASSWGRGGRHAPQPPQSSSIPASSSGVGFASSSPKGSRRSTLEGLPIAPFDAGSAAASSSSVAQSQDPPAAIGSASSRPFAPAPSFKPWRPGGSTDVLKPKLVYSVTESEDRRRMREERRQAMIAAMHAPRIHLTPAEIRARRRERQDRAAARRAERMRLLVAPSAELLASWDERSYRKDYDSSSGRRMAVAIASASTVTAAEPVVRSRAVPAASSLSEASDAAFSGGSDTDSQSKQQRSRLVASNSQKRLQAMRDEGRVLRQLRRESGRADELDAAPPQLFASMEPAPESSAVETSAVEEESGVSATDDEGSVALTNRRMPTARRRLARQISEQHIRVDADATDPTTELPVVAGPSVSTAQLLASGFSTAGLKSTGGVGLRLAASLATLEGSMTIRAAQPSPPRAGSLALLVTEEKQSNVNGHGNDVVAESSSIAVEASAISSPLRRRSSTGTTSHAKLHTGRVGLAPLLVADSKVATVAVPAGIEGLSVSSPAPRERRLLPQAKANTLPHDETDLAAAPAATSLAAASNPIYIPNHASASSFSAAASDAVDDPVSVTSLPPLSLVPPVGAIGSPVGVPSSSHPRVSRVAAPVSSLSAATQERVSDLRAIKAAEWADLARLRSKYESEKQMERDAHARRQQDLQRSQHSHAMQRNGSLPLLPSPHAGSPVFARDASGRLYNLAGPISAGSQSARTAHLSPSRSEGHLPALGPQTERTGQRRRPVRDSAAAAAGLHIRRTRRSNAAWMSPPQRRHQHSTGMFADAGHSDSEYEHRFDFSSAASDSDGGVGAGRVRWRGANDFRIQGNGNGRDASGMHRFVISERDPTAGFSAGLVSLPVSASLPSLRLNPARPSAAATLGAQSGFSVAIDSAQLAAHKHLSIDALLNPAMHLGKLHRVNQRRNRARPPVQPTLPDPQPHPQLTPAPSSGRLRMHRPRSVHPPPRPHARRPPAASLDRDLRGVQILRADADAAMRESSFQRDPYAAVRSAAATAASAVEGPTLPLSSDAGSSVAVAAAPPSLRRGLSFARAPPAPATAVSLAPSAVSVAGVATSGEASSPSADPVHASAAASFASPPTLRRGLSFVRLGLDVSNPTGSVTSGAVPGSSIPSALRIASTSCA